MIFLDSIAEISRLYLASVAAQASLCLTGSETPKDTICRVVAHLVSETWFYMDHVEMFERYKPDMICFITGINTLGTDSYSLNKFLNPFLKLPSSCFDHYILRFVSKNTQTSISCLMSTKNFSINICSNLVNK